MDSKCCICDNPGKYKCPKCKNLKYCSIACSKVHKETCVETPSPDTRVKNVTSMVDSDNTDTTLNIPRPLQGNQRIIAMKQSENLATQSTPLNQAQLDAIYDDNIKLALQNHELQAIIQTIVNSPNKQCADLLLRYQMESNPSFSDFIQGLVVNINKDKK